MQEKLEQFEKKWSLTLVNPLKNKPVISAKRVFNEKLNEQGKVVRNKVIGSKEVLTIERHKLFLKFCSSSLFGGYNIFVIICRM